MVVTVDDPADISTERNNAANTVSRLSILRVDTSSPDAALTATHEWNLTADLPAVGPNLGLEGIAWLPDDYLVGSGFRDQSTGLPYEPSNYPNHGTGVFFVGVEAGGAIYGYVLDHVGGGFHRVATIASGQTGVMDLSFDRDQETLWAYCDDTCFNRSTLLAVDNDATSPSFGQLRIYVVFERGTGPNAMPNLNNEGIAIAPETECFGAPAKKYIFYSDDGDTGGNSLRRDAIPCGTLF